MPKKHDKERWIEVILTTPPELSEALANFLTEIDIQGVIEEEAVPDAFQEIKSIPPLREIKAYLPWNAEAKQHLATLSTYIGNLSELFPQATKPRVETRKIVDPDWAEQWKKYFKPIRVTKDIIIKPTWERYTPAGRDIVIEIDPGMAFGTGQHPSTWLCIIAIEEILLKERTVQNGDIIDVGTGTGILAICCAKLGAENITGVDIDPQAVEIAGTNTIINGVADKVQIINRDISMCKGSYDLIIANLTATTLMNFHEVLISMLKPGGYIVMSGITDIDAPNVAKIFRSRDLALFSEKQEKEWVCFVFRKQGEAPLDKAADI